MQDNNLCSASEPDTVLRRCFYHQCSLYRLYVMILKTPVDGDPAAIICLKSAEAEITGEEREIRKAEITGEEQEIR